MAVQSIVSFGDILLRKKAKHVISITPRMIRILNDLVDTLYAVEGRAGLAAPQIGILRRMIVMDCGQGLMELINPQILDMRGEQKGPEACLSLPHYIGAVKRAEYVKVRAMNRHGEHIIIEGTGLIARCIQHEMDHLDGKLFVDFAEGNWIYSRTSGDKMSLADAINLSKHRPMRMVE
ncbi:peptide deformylase [Paenibacillus pini]|uniref:Peptide deformylase n=1 Tax=Paenibacillus pini JCM 16418 TaxID=1236976 RepID=W7YZK9_9BACL|nr:peptide deformylase [Paenibacillus pini]GAF10066.1 peptide deformylase [Paenibacillus pini JCM 16418]